MASFFAGLGTVLGWISFLIIALWIMLIPKSDKRYKTGTKGNASSPGCFLPIVGIIAGLLSYFLNNDADSPVSMFLNAFIL